MGLTEKTLQLLVDKDLLQLVMVRMKPKEAVRRIVQKVMTPIKLKEKYEQVIINMERKEKEGKKEEIEVRKQVEEWEKMVREMVAVVT